MDWKLNQEILVRLTDLFEPKCLAWGVLGDRCICGPCVMSRWGKPEAETKWSRECSKKKKAYVMVYIPVKSGGNFTVSVLPTS